MAKAAGGPALGGWKMGLAAAAGGLLVGGLAVALYYGVRVPSRDETEAIVHNYILDHGEILPEAMERLQQRQAASAVSQHRAALETALARRLGRRGQWRRRPGRVLRLCLRLLPRSPTPTSSGCSARIRG